MNKESLKYYQKMIKVLDVLNICVDLNLEEMKDNEIQEFNNLIIAFVDNKPVANLKNDLSIITKIKISNFLEIVSTPEAKAKGLDIADYMISQLSNKQQVKIKVETQVHSRFTPGLQSMIDKNKSLEILIEKLQLVEV